MTDSSSSEWIHISHSSDITNPRSAYVYDHYKEAQVLLISTLTSFPPDIKMWSVAGELIWIKKNALTQVEFKLKCDSSEFLVFSSVSFSGGDLAHLVIRSLPDMNNRSTVWPHSSNIMSLCWETDMTWKQFQAKDAESGLKWGRVQVGR